MKKLLLLFLILFNCNSVTAKSDRAAHELQASCPEVTCIDSIYIDCKKIVPCEKYPKVQIIEIKKSCDNLNIAEFSKFQVKIISNSSDPVTICAKFSSLESYDYKFKTDDLFILPESITIKDKSKLSLPFVPSAKIHPYVKEGQYYGKIIFTIGNL